MKKLLFLSSLAVALCATFAQAQTNTKEKSYGADFKQQQVMSPGRLTVLLKDKQKLENFQMSGYINEVCQKEGCWMILRSAKKANDDVLVKMKDHSFVLPKDAAGAMAVVNGTVVKKMQTVAEQKHYLEDAGAPSAEIAKITQPKEVYEMQATGVKLYNK